VMLAQAAMDPRTKKTIQMRAERDWVKVFINLVLALMFVPELRNRNV
jgi:hypothetical protein